MSHYVDNGSDYIDRVKAIPIRDVCMMLNVPVVDRGGRVWCKLRDERTPSCLLHTDTSPNTYIDFGGSNKKSDVIQFVSERKGISRGDAIKDLAAAFNITPNKQVRNSSELANWEYEKIGLHGDLATKNMRLDLERQGIEEVARLSDKYSIPMNSLRKQHPEIYEQLISEKAVPHIQNMRLEYYSNLQSLNRLCPGFDLANSTDFLDAFKKEVQDLQCAERLLFRAMEKTSIKAMRSGKYNPVSDFAKIIAGDLKPDIGNRTYDQMKEEAEKKHSKVKYQVIPCQDFTFDGLEKFPHTAFISQDNIVVGYLDSDAKNILPVLLSMKAKKPLDQTISDAERKGSSAQREVPVKKHEAAER